MAEGVGFEPTKLSFAGFQDRCTRPLCEPSKGKSTGKFAYLELDLTLVNLQLSHRGNHEHFP